MCKLKYNYLAVVITIITNKKKLSEPYSESDYLR